MSSSNGQVIEGLLVTGTIKIAHENVTIKNSMIKNPGDSRAIWIAYVDRDKVDKFTVENVSIIGTGAETYTQGIHGTYATPIISNVYVTGFGGGMFLSNGSGGDSVIYSMFENIKRHPGSHNTGMSTRGGSNKKVYRNWIEGSSSSALSLYPDASPITHMVTSENLFDGGTFSIRGGDGKIYGPQSVYNKFINNKFTRAHQYGPIAVFDRSIEGREWSNNYYLDGELIP